MKKLFTLFAVPLFAVMANATPVTVTYGVQEGEAYTAGQTVDVNYNDEPVATLTFGFAGGADFNAGKPDSHLTQYGFTAYTEGNGENGKADSGTAYIINPVYDGTVTVGVVLNSGKGFYVLKDGEALPEYNGITVEEKYYGTYTFEVVGGSEYTVYAAGTKLGFYGFIYNFEAEDEGDGDEGNDTMEVYA